MNRRDFVKLSPAFPVAAVTATLTLKEEGQPPIGGLDVSVLKLEPGDVVVLRVEGHILMATAERIKAHWECAVPGTRAFILADGMTVEGVLRGPAA